MVVDSQAEHSLKTIRALTGVRVPGLIRWEGPLRSFGSQGPDRRVCFRGYFSAENVCPLDVRICIEALKCVPELKGALIGSQSLFSDAAALVADIQLPCNRYARC